MISIFTVAILILSIVIHEVAHGLAALSQGDKTAKYAGRLTLNPISHIDPVGSILVPLICVILPGSIVFGWAKPVPYNPYNLKNGRWSELWVAFAGPLSNIVIMLAAALTIRFFGTAIPQETTYILYVAALINATLAFFNLVPLPPLDGSKILINLFPNQMAKFRAVFEQYGMIATVLFIFVLWQFLAPAVFAIVNGIAGV
ncbi:MAG TPA: site-2 protease family protein [Candidatus Paceibacterota bacterium]